MKIDGPRPTDTASADHARRTETELAFRRAADTRPAARGDADGDRVELSGDAALLTSALRAAHAAPDVRAGRVQQLRDLLAAGQVGTDSGALADAILGDLERS